MRTFQIESIAGAKGALTSTCHTHFPRLRHRTQSHPVAPPEFSPGLLASWTTQSGVETRRCVARGTAIDANEGEGHVGAEVGLWLTQ